MNNNNFFERHPKKTLSVIILVGFILCDILLAKVLTTAGVYAPQKKIEQYYRIKDPIFHHALKANIEHSDAVWGSMGYKIFTNSLGFKDKSAREVSLMSDKKRIVFIGDSFTEGVGFTYEDSFVGLIEKDLASKDIEVLNAAVSSYSPIIYYRKIKHYIENVGLEFDQLVLFLDISDIQDEATSYAFDENNNVVGHPSSKENEPEEKVKRFITDNTIILSNLRILIRKLKKKSPIKREPKIEDTIDGYRSLWTMNEDAYNDYGKEGVELALERMSMLRVLLKQKGIKLTLAVYPWPDQIWYKDLNSKQVAIWKRWAEENNAEFINLFPYFINDLQPLETLEKYFIVGDIHWNGTGHKLVAESFLEHFQVQ